MKSTGALHRNTGMSYRNCQLLLTSYEALHENNDSEEINRTQFQEVGILENHCYTMESEHHGTIEYHFHR